MICYAVIDTNVLVSALLSSHNDAATVQVVSRVFSGEIIPMFSAEILAEYREVLHRKKFLFSEDLISVLLDTFDKYGICIEPASSGEILPDRKDLPFYEVVMEMQEEDAYLVTGNIKHFPIKPFIVTANQMLAILDEKR